MNPFAFPIDTKTLLRKKASLKEGLLSQPQDWVDKRIAVLGGSTTNEVVEQLELFLLYHGIRAMFYQSEYGQYWQDAMFGNSELDSFSPDIIYVHTNWRNVEQFPNLTFSSEDVNVLLQKESEKFITMWQTLAQKFSCPIIQNNFDRPNYRLLGNRDVWDWHGRTNFLERLNQKLYEYAQSHENFYINDLDYLASDYGYAAWGNPMYWYLYKYAMCIDAIPYLAQSVSNIVKSIFGKNKKALVLDLDNTLWGGVVGDDGVEGIAVGQEVARGQVFYEFQAYCKELANIGVVLAIDSKTDMENALAGLNHPDGVLKLDDFVAIKANWNSKDQNLRELAEELTLGLDSFVFVDDNPAEREIVSVQLPGVSVPQMDRPETYIKALDHSGFFEATLLSKEDMEKTLLYRAKVEAIKAKSMFSDYGEYLDSLEMTAYIDDFKPIYVQRIAQLTNKTNQFNLTTLRCTENDIQTMQDDKNYICLCGRLVDKFADNGIVTVVVGEQIGKELHIRLWLMSCRVLKRGLEDAMMNVLVEQARKRKIERMVGYYYPTTKNGMVKNFYKGMQFAIMEEHAEAASIWQLDIAQYKRNIVHMQVVEKNLFVQE